MSIRNIFLSVASVLLSVAVCVAQTQEDDGFVIAARAVEGVEGADGRVVRLEGDVTIERGGATLVGRRGIYYEARGLAVIFGDVSGVDGESSISCDTLRYWRDSDRAYLIGNASYSDTAGVTTARRIHIYRREHLALCLGDAVAVDHDGTFELRAGRIMYDFDAGRAEAFESPRLITFDEEGEEEGTLDADLIEFSPDDDTVTAFGGVRITTPDVDAKARLAVLSGDGDSVELKGDPVVDQEGDLLTGERILVFTSEGKVSRVVALGGAGVTYTIESDDPSEPDQSGRVEGDTLRMYFDSGEPSLTTVTGRARSDHMVGDTGERNAVTSREIDIIFLEGKIRRVIFRGEAAGVYVFAPEEEEAAGVASESAEGQAAPGDTLGLARAAPVDTLAAGPFDEMSTAMEEEELASEEARSDTVELESVAYEARRIDYYVARNRIVLSEGARIQYKNMVLDAKRVVYDPDAQVMTATGSPDLRESESRLVGEGLVYDLERKAGVVTRGVTTFEDGLYTGRELAREPDGALLVGGGVYTTCSDSPPHYRLESHQMKVYLNDKVIARPLILYIGEIPVFALPFYVFPIRRERHSGFLIPQVEVGLSENKGRFIRNFGYYWAPSDYFDVTLWGDFYEQTKWVGHAEARYKKRYTLSGSVSTSFAEELLNNRRRWDLQFSHRQEIGRNWTAGASGDFRSDAAYAGDTYQTIEESVNKSLHSQVWLRGRWSGLSAGVTLDRQEDLDDQTVSELLPKVEVTASQRPLVDVEGEGEGWQKLLSRITYSWDADLVNDRDRSGGEQDVRQAAGIGVSVRGSGKALGWLNLSPRLSARQNWYDRDKSGRELPGRFTYSGALSAGTTIYGTFFPELGPVHALRHIVEPSASFSWTPEFADYFDESGSDLFYSPSGFGGTPRKKTSVSLSLVNKLQLKLRNGEELRRIDNLMRLSASTSYDFEAEGHRWADLTTALQVRPDPSVSLRWGARHDSEDWSLESSSMTASLSLSGDEPPESEASWEDRIASKSHSPVEELRTELARAADATRVGRKPWSGALTFRYSRGSQPSNSTYWLDGSVALSLTPNWRVNYSVHYDIKEGEVASQEYTIYRDLHCWEAQFTRRYYDDEWQYYFRVNVKSLPEIQAEQGAKHLRGGVR